MKTYELKLDDGRIEYVLFNNYFLRLLSRLINTKEAKSVEDTISDVFNVVKQWQELAGDLASSHKVFSDFDKICSDLVPVVCAASNAYKESSGLEEDTTLKSAEKILNHIEIESLIIILNGVVGCIIPKGLPEDKKKRRGRRKLSKTSWDEVIAFAYGELGIEKPEFFHMTYADYLIKSYFHQKRKDDVLKVSWEQARYIAFCTVATQTDRIKSPQQLMPFPWEDIKTVTKRQLNKIQKDASKSYEAHLRFLKMKENA